MKKLLVLCMCAVLAASVPATATTAFATETTTESTAVETKSVSFGNGILTASIPADESWQEISDDASCITISDGTNSIIFNHYSSVSDLPQVASYDAQHEMAFEMAYSKSDISVTLVGKITHTADYATVRKIIESINIDVTKIDSSHPGTHKASTDSYTVNEVNYTAWVKASDGLCIRDAASTSGNYVSSAAYASKVTVIGEVMKDGSDTGWRKVTTSDGVTGYCAGQFLSTTEITASSSESTQHRGESFLNDPDYPKNVNIYCAGDLRSVYLIENGSYLDEDGNEYYADSTFTYFTRTSDGVVYTQADAAGVNAADFMTDNSGSSSSETSYVTVTSEEGDTRTLSHNDATDAAGVYVDDYGIGYTQTDAGVWLSDDGIYYYE